MTLNKRADLPNTKIVPELAIHKADKFIKNVISSTHLKENNCKIAEKALQ